jgi:hypothetical protein
LVRHHAQHSRSESNPPGSLGAARTLKLTGPAATTFEVVVIRAR